MLLREKVRKLKSDDIDEIRINYSYAIKKTKEK